VELLVREGNARAEGTLYVDLQLNLIDKAVLLARRVRMPLTVRKDLPVEIPGGTLARTAALGVLSLASQPFGKTQARDGIELLEGIKLAAALLRDYAPALLLANTRFSVSDPAGIPYVVECMGVGFRINVKQFLLPKAVIEPWKFDPEIAAIIQRERWKLDPLSVDLDVWPSEARLQTSAGGSMFPPGFSKSRSKSNLY